MCLVPIQHVPCLYLGLETIIPDWDFLWFSTIPPGNSWDVTLKKDKYFCPHSFQFIIHSHPLIWHYIPKELKKMLSQTQEPISLIRLSYLKFTVWVFSCVFIVALKHLSSFAVWQNDSVWWLCSKMQSSVQMYFIGEQCMICWCNWTMKGEVGDAWLAFWFLSLEQNRREKKFNFSWLSN